MKQYIFFFHGGWPPSKKVEENRKKWGLWMANLSESKHIRGERFQPTGKIISDASGSSVADLVPGKDTMGAYVIVEANIYDEAVALTKNCPLFDHGGTVEVREIMPT